MSTNKLFIVCPFSNLEGFLRYKFGPESLFASAMAGIPNIEDSSWLESLGGTIRREGITELYLVQDLQCRFAQCIRSQDKGYGTHAEAALQAIMDNCEPPLGPDASWSEKAICFAREILSVQTERVAAIPLVQQLGLNVRGIVTDKGMDLLWVYEPSNHGETAREKPLYSVVA